MTATLPLFGISYVSVPKNACTSLKKLMFRIENERPHDPHMSNGVVRTVHHLYPTQPLEKWRKRVPTDHWTFTVMRHPVERLISVYTDKILTVDTLRNTEMSAKDQALGLTQIPTLPMFVRHLQSYRRMSKDIRHHTQPQVHFLGREPALFDRIYTMGELDALVADLSERTCKSLRLKRTNESRHARAEIAPLSDDDRALIEEFYSEDFAAFGAYF